MTAPTEEGTVEPKTNAYRKKPVVIEAFQFQRRNNGPIGQPDWFHDAVTRNDVILQNTGKWGDPTQPAYCEIKTIEGVMRANEGDWIIQGVKGELYPCKPDIFAATYEPAGASRSPVVGVVGGEPKPLTEEQIREAVQGAGLMFTAPDVQVARAVEAAHGIKVAR